MEYEDPETMSNIEGPIGNFARGGFIRSSLPIVRSPPNTFDRPLGIVFLIYGNETKKAVLPNKITHLDTVRALFVRSFPGRLSMQYLQSSKRKIYILESKTNIYYLLEDLRDIKDRTVLKIHEYESDEQQRVREQTPEVRGKSTAAPLRDDTPQQVPDHHHGDTPATAITDQVRKAQTLPQTSNMARSYPPFIEGYPIELERPKSHTLDSARGQPRGHPSATYARIAHQSPDRQLASPDRNLRPIPENLQAQNGYMQGNTYEDYDYPYQPIYAIHNHPGHPSGPLLRSMSPPAQRTQPPPGDPIRRAMSPPPSAFSQNYDQFRAPGGPGAPGAPPQTYVAKSTKAATGVHPSRATGPGGGSAAHSNRHSLAFTPMTDTALAHGVPVHQRSQSYRVSPDKEPHYMVPVRPRSVTPQPLIHDVETKYRMDQMEAQIANLAAWVQTAVSNESSRASSVRSTTPSEVIGSNIGSKFVQHVYHRMITSEY
ncbi:hypothetical protein KUTeg_008944 [Tegillarca granosa]|uniref:Actin interacting protein 3-like C-terminal domain-containing protein n=1 Tax=Tegillarca granosa TaxID=220873 RepID=A0ABQ9FFD8_TEGGR|nr:hypothetical protein KUTeg_008944 [Tegillarca granosa]